MTGNTPDTQTNEFRDPLENYDLPVSDDPLEQALVEETVAAIRHEPFATITPETPIRLALETLDDLEIGCLLVSDGGRLVGLFSNRDVLDKIVDDYEQLKDEPVSKVMTPEPVFVFETDSSAAALCVMAVGGFRHVPVLDVDHKIVGIVSPQRVTAFLQKQLE